MNKGNINPLEGTSPWYHRNKFPLPLPKKSLPVELPEVVENNILGFIGAYYAEWTIFLCAGHVEKEMQKYLNNLDAETVQIPLGFPVSAESSLVLESAFGPIKMKFMTIPRRFFTWRPMREIIKELGRGDALFLSNDMQRYLEMKSKWSKQLAFSAKTFATFKNILNGHRDSQRALETIPTVVLVFQCLEKDLKLKEKHITFHRKKENVTYIQLSNTPSYNLYAPLIHVMTLLSGKSAEDLQLEFPQG